MYEVTIRLKANQSGYSAELMFTDAKGKPHEKAIRAERKGSQNSNYLQALIEALTVLQKPCMLSIYSASDHLTESVRQGWLSSWALHDWKNAKGKEVRNAEQWKQVKKLLSPHSAKFIREEKGNNV